MVTLDSIRDIKIYQTRSGYRFSVDALLLYSFIDVKTARKIADLGAGSGIVGILLAKKYRNAGIALIEIQKGLAALAEKNITLNSLGERVRVIRADVREIKTRRSLLVTPHSFDIAVSNPPFRKEMSGRLNPDEEKAIARHEIKLKLPELVKAADYLLKPKGKFFFIHLPERLAEIIETLSGEMEVKRLRLVHSDKNSEAKMVLVEAIKGSRKGLKVESPLYIRNEKGGYSGEMDYILGKQSFNSYSLL